MIDWNTQIKIQAFLDGELPEAEAREIAALIAGDQWAAALHKELKNTRRAMGQAEAGLQLPETREFYWGKISREIERLEREKPQTATDPVWQALARWLKPLGAVAAVAIVGLFAWQQTNNGAGSEAFVTAQVDSGAMVFQDESSGTTFVWFGYPADNGVANADNSNTLN